MSNHKQRIVIGVPCYREVAPEILDDWMRFAYHCGRRLPDYDFLIAIKTKSEQFRARNAIVESARQMNADWLLMLDDDMIINHWEASGFDEAGRVIGDPSYSFLERMIAHDKDICGALYYQRGGACAPVLMTRLNERGYRFLTDEEVTHGLQRVDVAGGGCLLIKMRVFDKIDSPYFAPEFEWGTDIQLCRRAAEAGFEVWADTSIEFGHLKNERVLVTSRNKNQFRTDDIIPGEVKREFVAADVYNRLIDDASQWTGYSRQELLANTHPFHQYWGEFKARGFTDLEWYKSFPKERVARQVWYNTQVEHKRRMTEVIMTSTNHFVQQRILDFGCGIGLTAYSMAERGHKVVAADIAGTGTFEFLRWRKTVNSLPIEIVDAAGPDRGLEGKYDVIIAMDCLEHFPNWREVMADLVSHLRVGGCLFANNAVLDDQDHPEHYPLKPHDFLVACAEMGLKMMNDITYFKYAEVIEQAPVS